MSFLKQNRKDKRKNLLFETGMLTHENFNYKIIQKMLFNGYKVKEFKRLAVEMKIVHLS